MRQSPANIKTLSIAQHASTYCIAACGALQAGRLLKGVGADC